MLLSVIFIIAIVVGFLFLLLGDRRASQVKKSSYYDNDAGIGFLFFGGLFIIVGFLALFISGPIVSAIGYSKQGEANSIYSKMETIVAQRDQMVPLVKDELSADEFAALMEATSTDSQAFQILHANGVSELLIERAGRIIALNQQVFDLRNKALDAELEVCAMRNNPFIPRLPFFFPECRVEFKGMLTEEPTVTG